jgi:aldehyde dehydrogenase (NAD+)
MAAKHLTPVTLELGGKSPAIVDKEVNLDVAARRIVWAKFFNAGQTCVAPDYLLVHKSRKDELIEKLISNINEFYGPNPEDSEHLTHIVNDKRYQVLEGYLKGVNIIYGGKTIPSKRIITPTIVDQVPADHPLLHDEIFGPILPVLTFNEVEEVIPIVRMNRYPLACYIFTNDKNFENHIIQNIEFGGGCINNALVHLVNPRLPFGGVGNSGMGRYHGKYSFEVFSHYKSVLNTSTMIDISLRYPPYTEKKVNWAKRFFD